MPDAWEVVHLASAAYSDTAELDPLLVARGWEVYAVSPPNELGYSGVAYVNDHTHEVAIVHRGTDELFGLDGHGAFPGDGPGGTDLDDCIAVAFEHVPEQFSAAQSFSHEVNNHLFEDGRIDAYHVFHDGHSLGAVFSDLLAFQEGRDSFTVDNPGTREILESTGWYGMLDPDHFHSFQSNPNLINTTNEQLGWVHHIGTEVDTHVPIFYDLEQHHIETISHGVDFCTGEPWVVDNVPLGEHHHVIIDVEHLPDPDVAAERCLPYDVDHAHAVAYAHDVSSHSAHDVDTGHHADAPLHDAAMHDAAFVHTDTHFDVGVGHGE